MAQQSWWPRAGAAVLIAVDGLNGAIRSFAAANPDVQVVDWRAAAQS